MRPTVRQLIFAVTLAALPSSLLAQADVSFLAGQSAQMGTSMYLAEMVRRQSAGNAAQRGDHGGGAHPSRPPVAPVASLTYRVDPAVTQQTLRRFVAQARRVDKASGDEIQRVLKSQDVMATARAYLGRYGMKTTNVADCVTLYLTQAWLATRGSQADPTAAQMRGVRNQVTMAMRSTPLLARASDATKQDMGVSNLLEAMVAGNLATQGSKDRKQLPTIRRNIAKGARASYGIDILSLKLTDAGFVSS